MKRSTAAVGPSKYKREILTHYDHYVIPANPTNDFNDCFNPIPQTERAQSQVTGTLQAS